MKLSRKLIFVAILSVAILPIACQADSLPEATKEIHSRTPRNPPIKGSWDVWIPGSVVYTATETAVYGSYSHGSGMPPLNINDDLSYNWGNVKSKLELVKPWYAEEGKAYYQIKDGKENTYVFWYKESTDQLVVLFGEVGGHAATGSRIKAGNNNVAASQPEKTSPVKVPVDQAKTPATPVNVKKPVATSTKSSKASRSVFKKGDKVSILWQSQWYKGSILETSTDGKYKVRYDGWGSLWDEWVDANRLRK